MRRDFFSCLCNQKRLSRSRSAQMEDDRRISTYNLADREVVMLLTTAPAAPSRPNPAIMQRMMDEASRDPVMARVMDSNPRLRAALQSRDMDAFWRELAPMLPQLVTAQLSPCIRPALAPHRRCYAQISMLVCLS